MAEMIQINFGKVFPLFPMADACLLPHATIPLHIAEPAHIQMVEDSLDGPGQIAMAVYEGSSWMHSFATPPPIRPVVCLSQIERHEKLQMGRYNILVQGICRAQITEQFQPDKKRPYSTATLTPLEKHPEGNEPSLIGWRARMCDLFESDAFSRLRFQSRVLDWLQKDDIPSHVLVEIIGHLLISTSGDSERRYALLCEPDVMERASITETELDRLESIIDQLLPQVADWPKGMSWN